jgi:diguanylate cyclase (GGDEF)-like protein
MPYLSYAEIDFFGAVLLLVFYLNQRQSEVRSLEDRLFNAVLGVTMVMLVLDGALWMLHGVVYPHGHAILRVLTSLSFIINPTVTFFWLYYCDLRVFSDERGMRKRLALYSLPLVINTGTVLANLFTPLVFHIDGANLYHRDMFFFIYVSVFYLYLIGSSVMLIHKMSHCETASERREFRYLLLFSIPPFIGGILQTLFYGTSLSWPCTVISIAIVYINVLNRQISTDTLTGLNNRRMLKRYLDLRINAADETTSLYVIMLDADNFKNINDTYGHKAGDRALTQLADILKTLCKHRECFLARLGGDEFVIIGSNHHTCVMETLLSELDTEIRKFNESGMEPYRLAISTGTARYDVQTVNTTDLLLTAADQSMYAVKAAKRNMETAAK